MNQISRNVGAGGFQTLPYKSTTLITDLTVTYNILKLTITTKDTQRSEYEIQSNQ